VKRAIPVLAVVVASLAAAPSALAHSAPSLSTVLSHTRAADAALDRAVTNFNAHAFGAGRNAFAQNRSAFGKAVAERAELVRNASTPAQRLAAARAVVAVAKQGGANERALAKVARVLPRGSDLQVAVVRAAGKDAARSVAVARLTELLATVPDAAKEGLMTALANVTRAHGPAVAQLGRDVASSAVGSKAKAAAASALNADIAGQAAAIDVLEAIKPELPQSSQEGIDTALGAIADSLDAQAAALAAVQEHAPEARRSQIEAAITAAHAAAEDARS
jgi:hypothetical protein